MIISFVLHRGAGTTTHLPDRSDFFESRTLRKQLYLPLLINIYGSNKQLFLYSGRYHLVLLFGGLTSSLPFSFESSLIILPHRIALKFHRNGGGISMFLLSSKHRLYLDSSICVKCILAY